MRVGAAIFVMLAACGDDGAPGRDAGPSSIDAGRDANAPGRDAGEPRRIGYVSIIGSDYMEAARVTSHAIYVNFYEPGTECIPVMEFGDCTLVDCPTAPGSDERWSAGDVTITRDDGDPIVRTPDAMGSYEALFSTEESFLTGGETIRAVAAGDEVGAFDLTTRAPPRLVLTEPVFPAGATTPLVIARDAAFDVTWDPPAGSQGTVGLRISGQGVDFLPSIVCDFAIADGSGSVSADALQMLPAGGGEMDARAYNTSSTAVGDYDVTLQLQVTAVTPGDRVTARAISLE
jgi:hypothetical protein